ncbi:MAG: cytidine deaminase [Anaerovibrio sp.]|uniref:cytidine deaminase n=1 Tax=Anaerovibrio sp. TaxID=1872532 RepID=UPI0025CFFD77|nr:cytidine deaminase [Anaerovibrio sp.]MCR5175391.1 cytidine deaminase [Anaerovibrio sp.]
MGLDQGPFSREELITAALENIGHSYAPYSGFNVSAAVLMSNGKIYTGANIENAAYSATVCAERCAIFKAVSEDREAKIIAIAIVGGRDCKTDEYCPPCGVCRQVMREFAVPDTMKIILAKTVEDYIETTLEALLPMSFGPDHLR